MATPTKIRFGMNTPVERNFYGATVGDILGDRALLAELGASEDVSAVSGGQTLGSDALVADYEVITLEKQGSSKA